MEDIKKIGIITFHAAFNFGSMLQAYALQTFLQKQGHEVEIINFRSNAQKEMYAFPTSVNSFMRFFQICKRVLLHPEATAYLKHKWRRFNEFLNTQLNLTKEYETLEELKNAGFEYDLIIYGSDQIWNTTAKDFNTVYVESFCGSAKKIAYAVSMGPFPEKTDSELLKPFLNDFAGLSFREERSANIIRPFLSGKEFQLACDPSLLLEGKEYFPLFEGEPLIPGRYIYCYTPYLIDDILPLVEKIGADTNLPVVINNYCSKKIVKKYPHVYLSNGGPCEFINLIKYSEFTFGHSFHLLTFSLTFEKEFYLIDSKHDSRLDFMLDKFSLSSRRIMGKDIIDHRFVRTGIDYDRINKELNCFRGFSFDFLTANI